MIEYLIRIIDFLARILSLLVIVYVILSYFMSPYHSIRLTLAKIVEPLLSPLRRLIPTVQGIDFSPFVLILIIQLVEILLVRLLRAFLG